MIFSASSSESDQSGLYHRSGIRQRMNIFSEPTGTQLGLVYLKHSHNNIVFVDLLKM